MGRLRFVQPKVTRLQLSDGDFVDIKHELTAGEERESFARMTKSLEAGKVAQLNPEQVQLSTLVAYILGWSFTDKDGRPVEVSESAIRQLDPETFVEIHKAIEAHETALADQKKASRVDATKSSETLALPSV